MKKYSIITFLLFLVIILSVTVGQAQRTIPTASQFAEKISPVLDEAGYPLSDQQLAQISEIQSETGVFKAVMEVLTDEQKSALRNKRPRRHMKGQHEIGIRNRGNINPLRGIVETLTNAGCPLLEEQIAQIREEGKGSIRGILTDEQKTALHAVGLNKRIRHISQKLSTTDYPLTEEQITAIQALEPGPEARGALQNILTDEQKELLRRNSRRRPGMFLAHLRRVLTNTEYPLTEDQITALREIEPGPNARAEVMEILTEQQEEILRNLRDVTTFPADETDETIGIEKEESRLQENVLKQNQPNPFNPTTTISYNLTKSGNVSLEIFNSQGQKVASLVQGYQEDGYHSVQWDASLMAAGTYFYVIKSDDFTSSKKMLLIK